MSGSLSLSALDLQSLGGFLDDISEATRQHGVQLAPYGRSELEGNGTHISFTWDAEKDQYVLDDRVGD